MDPSILLSANPLGSIAVSLRGSVPVYSPPYMMIWEGDTGPLKDWLE